MPDPERCNARIEIESGETVTPCHLAKGHDGPHEGWCLGSRAAWMPSGQKWIDPEAEEGEKPDPRACTTCGSLASFNGACLKCHEDFAEGVEPCP